MSQFSGVRMNTVATRLPRIVSQLMTNVPMLTRIGNATAIRPLEGQPCIVAGAGPSLVKNAKQVAAAQDRGVAVICVNTALGALKRAGIKPDVCVCVEAIPSNDMLDTDAYSMAVMDWSCPPSTFRAVPPEKTLWCAMSSSMYFRGLEALGNVRPVVHSGAATLCAVSLVMGWGASKVALVGCDLSYSKDGQCYAKGSTWENWKATYTSEGIKFVGGEERNEVRRAVGVPEVPRDQVRFALPPWGKPDAPESEHVPTDVNLLLQVSWFKHAAPHLRGKIVNCTEGGAHLEGIPDKPLVKLGLSAYKERDFTAPCVTEDGIHRFADYIEDEGKRALNVFQRWMECDYAGLFRESADGLPWAEGYVSIAQAQRMRAGQGGNPVDKLRAFYASWEDAGKRLIAEAAILRSSLPNPEPQS